MTKRDLRSCLRLEKCKKNRSRSRWSHENQCRRSSRGEHSLVRVFHVATHLPATCIAIVVGLHPILSAARCPPRCYRFRYERALRRQVFRCLVPLARVLNLANLPIRIHVEWVTFIRVCRFTQHVSATREIWLTKIIQSVVFSHLCELFDTGGISSPIPSICFLFN